MGQVDSEQKHGNHESGTNNDHDKSDENKAPKQKLILRMRLLMMFEFIHFLCLLQYF